MSMGQLAERLAEREEQAENAMMQALYALAVALWGDDDNGDGTLEAYGLVVMGEPDGFEGPEWEAAVAAVAAFDAAHEAACEGVDNGDR